jgi:hypothetical protein
VLAEIKRLRRLACHPRRVDDASTVPSTLRRYAAALGATCEVAFVMPNGRRVLIAEHPPGHAPK